MNKSVLISSFIFIIIAITNAQFNKEDLKSSTQSSFFSMLKSLAIEYLNDNSEIGHMLLHHAEKCPFYCLNDADPYHDHQYTPVPNGCGTFEMQFDFKRLNLKGITKCCNKHDICYGTCNMHKYQCDKAFKKCLTNYCSELDKKDKLKVDVCNKGTYVMYESVKLLGCVAYTKSQATACIC